MMKKSIYTGYLWVDYQVSESYVSPVKLDHDTAYFAWNHIDGVLSLDEMLTPYEGKEVKIAIEEVANDT